MTNKQRQNYLTLHKKTDIESNISCPSVMPILQYISFDDFAPIQFIAVFPCEQARPHKKYSWFISSMSTQYELEKSRSWWHYESHSQIQFPLVPRPLAINASFSS